VARTGLRWGKVASAALAVTCVIGTVSCSDEDEPEPGQDAALDRSADTRSDTSVVTDVSAEDRSVVDQREAGTPDASTDPTAPDGGTTDGGTTDGGTDAAPEGGNCVGGGDAARDGALGMLAVQALNCANCHQDEPVDAGLILSGRTTTTVPEAGVFPKNLTPDPMTGLGCWTDDQIITAFMTGVGEQGQTICDRMPRFGARIDAGVAQEIANFLRTLPAVSKAIPETLVCPPRPEPRPDAGTDADASGPDGGTDGGADAGTDGASPPDSGSDAAPDGGQDSASPDVALPDVGNDGVSTDVDIDGG